MIFQEPMTALNPRSDHRRPGGRDLDDPWQGPRCRARDRNRPLIASTGWGSSMSRSTATLMNSAGGAAAARLHRRRHPRYARAADSPTSRPLRSMSRHRRRSSNCMKGLVAEDGMSLSTSSPMTSPWWPTWPTASAGDETGRDRRDRPRPRRCLAERPPPLHPRARLFAPSLPRCRTVPRRLRPSRCSRSKTSSAATPAAAGLPPRAAR